MKRVVTAEEMRAFERRRFQAGEANSLDWMEKAARGVADEALRRYGKARYLVLCGGGNNGGDGFAAARLLLESGCKCLICMMRSPELLRGDARVNYERARSLGVPMERGLTDRALHDCDVVIDALFGTGLSRALEQADAACTMRVNAANKPVVAVDMPSGADATTGAAYGAAIRADCTVTFQYLKSGQLFYPARSLCGELVVCPLCEEKEEGASCGLLEREDIARLLPERARDAHKGVAGRLLLCVGSGRYTGAALMSAGAALRAGAGVTSVAVTGRVKEAFTALPEVCAIRVSERDDWDEAACAQAMALFDRQTALAIGSGVGDGDIRPLIETALRTGRPCVLDADALNQIAKDPRLLGLLHPNAILTPHPAEMARLCGLTTNEVVKDPLTVARTYANRWNCTVLLKGATSVISDATMVRVNTTGNAGLAKGGSGDVLTGVVAALLSQGLSPFDAACVGAYLLGVSADAALSLLTTRALIAGDVIDAIASTVARYKA